MGNLTNYFEKTTYKPTYFLGDRVRGTFEGVMYSGTVGNDFVKNEDEGPIINVLLDLPLKIKDKVYGVLTVKHNDVKILK